MNPVTSAVDTDTDFVRFRLCWERAGNTRLAMHRYEDALLQRPMNRFARQSSGGLHLASGHLTAAALRLARSLDYRPNDLAARVAFGHVLQVSGRYAEARRNMRRRCRWSRRRGCRRWSGQKPRSVENGSEAIAAQKAAGCAAGLPGCVFELAELYSLAGHDQQARNITKKALSLHHRYIECRISFARHELRMGRRLESARQFRRALAIHEQHIELYVGLALAMPSTRPQFAGDGILRSAARLSRNAAC